MLHDSVPDQLEMFFSTSSILYKKLLPPEQGLWGALRIMSKELNLVPQSSLKGFWSPRKVPAGKTAKI